MLDGREGRNAAPKDAREEKEDEEWKETEDEEEREEERPRNLRFHLVTRACPSRFSSSPYGCSLDGGWGPWDEATCRLMGPSSFPLSLSLPLSISFSLRLSLPPPSLPSLSTDRETTVAGGQSTGPHSPQPLSSRARRYTTFSRYASRAWWSSRMITRYEFLSARRESRGTSPRLEHVTLAERVFGWTRWIRLEDSNGWLGRGEGSGQVSREEICLDSCLRYGLNWERDSYSDSRN